MTELVAFRALQGLGVGGLMALSQAIIGDVVPPRERGRYQVLIGSAFGVATIGGPLRGRFLVDNASWRWCSSSACRSACWRWWSCSGPCTCAWSGRTTRSTGPATRCCWPARPRCVGVDQTASSSRATRSSRSADSAARSSKRRVQQRALLGGRRHASMPSSLASTWSITSPAPPPIDSRRLSRKNRDVQVSSM